MVFRLTVPMLTVLALFMLTACEETEQQAKPVPEVLVLPAEKHAYQPNASFNARIQSRSDVSIKAQVTGKLIALHFTEGDQVEAGAKLFDIDPAPFRAAVNKAEADLAKAKASDANASRNYKRGKTLVKDGYISGAELDNLESAMQEAQAAVKSAEAALESAKVDLEYTTITAPQAGRLGRSIHAVGDVVGPQSGALTTLVGQNDMDAVFQLPEALIVATRARKPGQPSAKDIEVVLTLPDDSRYSETGPLDYFSNRVDTATGTVEVRARMANPEDVLRPGMYVRATLRVKKPISVLMVPQSAVQVDQQGTYVLTVTDASEVSRVNVTTSERVDENVVVTGGLEEGASVIIRGVQKARPGDTVKTAPYQPATQATDGDAS